jgi:hypothetical protein
MEVDRSPFCFTSFMMCSRGEGRTADFPPAADGDRRVKVWGSRSRKNVLAELYHHVLVNAKQSFFLPDR